MNTTLKLVQVIIAIAVLIQTLEYISLKKSFSANGVWRWSEIKTEFSFLPNNIQALFNFLLKDDHFIILLWVRLINSLILILSPSPFVILTLLFTTLLIAQRFRGSFNGGSDYMTLIILSALAVQSFSTQALITKGVLWYIALQSCTSYFIAGVVKIKQSAWRQGSALREFIQSPNYNPPTSIKNICSHKVMSFVISWGVMVFELTFPLILIQHNQIITGSLLLLAFTFHLINVLLFGLNRFLIAWLATYPAIYFCTLG